MSRIGKMPVVVPGGAKVDVGGDGISVSGPKGELTLPLLDKIDVKVEDNTVMVECHGDDGFAVLQPKVRHHRKRQWSFLES